MGKYQKGKNFVDHDFRTTTITIDGTTIAEGVDTLAVELEEEETTVDKVADGSAIMVVNPSSAGSITIEMLEASATNDDLWALRESGRQFPVSVLDSAAPNLNCNASYMRIAKPPVVHRSVEHAKIEWKLVAAYLNVKGGSYALAAV